MSTTKTTLPLDVAHRAAERLVTTLAPACARIEIAGSIRRGKPEVGDIELVAIPSVVEATQLDLFGKARAVQKRNLLDEELERLIEKRAISRTPPSDGVRPAWGEHYKKLWLAAGGQVVQVDLFLATPENWGAIFCIRTGPAAFSQALVTHLKLHTPYRQQDGALVVEATGEVVPVPEEADYFRLAGVPYIEPEERSAGRLHRLLSQSRPSSPMPGVVNIRDLPSGWQRDARYVYIGRRNSRYGWRIRSGSTRSWSDRTATARRSSACTASTWRSARICWRTWTSCGARRWCAGARRKRATATCCASCWRPARKESPNQDE